LFLQPLLMLFINLKPMLTPFDGKLRKKLPMHNNLVADKDVIWYLVFTKHTLLPTHASLLPASSHATITQNLTIYFKSISELHDTVISRDQRDKAKTSRKCSASLWSVPCVFPSDRSSLPCCLSSSFCFWSCLSCQTKKHSLISIAHYFTFAN
jgi:hypothetical protein